MKKQSAAESLNVRIKCEITEQVTEEKCLGLSLNSQFNFQSHVKKMCKVVEVNMNCIRVVRNCLTFDCTLINLNMPYGSTVWSQTNQSIMKFTMRL